MNHKINKVINEIEKMKGKIANYQSRLRELERTKTEMENADIVAMVRAIEMPPAEFEAFARAFMEQRKIAVPDGFIPPVDGHGNDMAEGAETDRADMAEGMEHEYKEGGGNEG